MLPLQYASMPEVLKLLVVEDHPVYLEGLSYILKKLSEQVILTCVNSKHEAQALLAESQDYDLVLLDLGLPDGGGVSILRFLSHHKIFVPAIILSASEDDRDVQRAINAGASGYISKASGSDEILGAIKKIMSGERYLPDFYNDHDLTGLPKLTPRQKEVLKLVAEGLPNKRICQRLNLTEHTVKSHMKMLFSALNVHNRTECVRVAVEWNLITD
jgi:DNA-binding NarL/FixJ family response regulator